LQFNIWGVNYSIPLWDDAHPWSVWGLPWQRSTTFTVANYSGSRLTWIMYQPYYHKQNGGAVYTYPGGHAGEDFTMYVWTDCGRVQLQGVIDDPTPTPVLTLGVDLVMPRSMYHPGDVFYLTARVGNPGESLGNLPLVVLFDAFGQYFFWPGWQAYAPPEQPDIDYSWIPVIHGIQEIPILPSFTWPDTGDATVTGLYFYGALLSADFQMLIGTMDVVEFGYGP
jgi:hypothetical protein